MTCETIRFGEMEWAPGGHLKERKKGPVGDVVLLEFAPGFEDPNWCPRSHVIYVLQGELELELEDGISHAKAGEAVVLDAGTRHRARNHGSETVKLFVLSDR